MGHATTLTALACADRARPVPGGYFDPGPWRPGLGGRKETVSLVMTVHWLNTAA
jgi:hypothetical protein